MAQLTTFNQQIGSKTVRLAVPVTRVTKVIDKFDMLIDEGKIKQAEKVIAPFIIVDKKTKKVKKVTEPTEKKGAKKEAALSLITKLQEYGRNRSQIIEQLQHDLQMSYANARHYVVNVAKVA